MTIDELGHLLSETTARPAGPRWRRTAVGGLLVTAIVSGGAVAVAGGPSVFRQDNGVVAIDGQSLRPWYEGAYLTADQVEALQEEGRAMTSVTNRELACRGISLLVDDDAQWHAYSDGYEKRLAAVRAVHPDGPAGTVPAGTDPCADWRTPVPGLPDVPQAG